MILPAHLETLKNEALQTSCEAWAMRCRWPLSKGIDRDGPCPNCAGRDRFAIHIVKNTFLCRRCGISGEGVIKLVMETQGVDFVRACEIITGRTADAPIDPDHARKVAEQAERERERQAEQAERYRRDAIKAGRKIWDGTAKVDWVPGHPVFDYLRRRGINAGHILDRAHGALVCLRYSGAHEWGEQQERDWVVLACGPAMIAGIQDPAGGFAGAHRTWIDLSQPKGRLILPPNEAGKERDTKKVRGTQKGCAIRLYTPENPRRLVCGEGIETTASALCHAFEPDTAYWALINLGNMSGRALRKPSGGWLHDQPDMDDGDAFVPPEWCEEMFFLAEGDSPESKITEKLTRGLRRAMRLRPGLKGFLVPAPGPGQDLNDVAMAMMANAEGVGA